jgi:hypothetical protein
MVQHSQRGICAEDMPAQRLPLQLPTCWCCADLRIAGAGAGAGACSWCGEVQGDGPALVVSGEAVSGGRNVGDLGQVTIAVAAAAVLLA